MSLATERAVGVLPLLYRNGMKVTRNDDAKYQITANVG